MGDIVARAVNRHFGSLHAAQRNSIASIATPPTLPPRLSRPVPTPTRSVVMKGRRQRSHVAFAATSKTGPGPVRAWNARFASTQIAADTTGYFDWLSGTLTAPAYGGLPITVTFEGGDAPGSYRTSVRITADQGPEFAVPVIVAVAPSSATQITRETNRTAGGLTGRELEIMLLVAQGNTSRQIGQALFISPRTVEMHVQGSLLKLGCRTRAQAVRRLAELGTLPPEVSPAS